MIAFGKSLTMDTKIKGDGYKMKANKNELVTKVAEIGNMTKKDATDVLQVVFDALEETVVDDLKGFTLGKLGTFKLEDVGAREYRIPNKPGETVLKPAHKRVKFTVNSATKKEIEKKTR